MLLSPLNISLLTGLFCRPLWGHCILNTCEWNSYLKQAQPLDFDVGAFGSYPGRDFVCKPHQGLQFAHKILPTSLLGYDDYAQTHYFRIFNFSKTSHTPATFFNHDNASRFKFCHLLDDSKTHILLTVTLLGLLLKISTVQFLT